MISTELIEFVERQITRGVSREIISKTLMEQGGWTASDLEEVFRVAGGSVHLSADKPVLGVPARHDAPGAAVGGVSGEPSSEMTSVAQTPNSRGTSQDRGAPAVAIASDHVNPVSPILVHAQAGQPPSAASEMPAGFANASDPLEGMLSAVVSPPAAEPRVFPTPATSPTAPHADTATPQTAPIAQIRQAHPLADQKATVISATLSTGVQRKRGSWVVATTALVLLVLVLAGGVYAWITYFEDKPEFVLREMIRNLGELETFSYRGSVDADTTWDIDPMGAIMSGGQLGGVATETLSGEPMEPGERKSFTLIFSGDVDIKDPRAPRSSLDMNILSETSPMGREDVIPVRFGVDLRSFPGLTFVRLRNLPAELSLFSDLSQVDRKWVSIDHESVKSALGLNELEAALEAALASTTSEKSDEITEEDIDLIKAAFVKAEVLEVREVLPAEDVDGVSAYHYRLGFNQAGVIEFVKEVARIVEEPLTEEDVAELAVSLEEVRDLEVDIWIGKSDKQLRRLALDLDNDDIVSSVPGMRGTSSASLSISMANHNGAVDIEEPQGALDVMELFGQFLSGGTEGLEGLESITGPRSKSESPAVSAVSSLSYDAKRKSDLTTIKMALAVSFDVYQDYPDRLDALPLNYPPRLNTLPVNFNWPNDSTIRDPETGQLYQYETLNGFSEDYQLCATLSDKIYCVTPYGTATQSI